METKALVQVSVRKPQRDTKFAKRAADILVDIVKQNNWGIKLGGDKQHLVYEAWQTLGKYYGYTVNTFEAEEVEIGGITGFKAKARVINENTGIEVGGAEAYCMRDEKNWANKPTFQLASMAQTRAGAKALRQILAFVVALAGYNPTPAEEMTGEENTQNGNGTVLASEKQIGFIKNLLVQKGFIEEDLKTKYKVEKMEDLFTQVASTIIENLLKLPDVSKEEVDINDVPENLEAYPIE